MIVAKYDLSWKCHPPTFDFSTWLVHVQKLGAGHICLAHTKNPRIKFGDHWTRERIKSIIIPCIDFSGLPWSKNDNLGERMVEEAKIGVVGELVKWGYRPLQSVLKPRDVKYTVTLRNDRWHNTNRNTDPDVWRKFAEQIGALVIEDYQDQPMHLHDRMALYAGAKMNYGNTGGAFTILIWTKYPYMMCECGKARKHWPAHGIADMQHKMSWASKNQIMAWEDATLDSLLRRHESVEKCSSSQLTSGAINTQPVTSADFTQQCNVMSDSSSGS